MALKEIDGPSGPSPLTIALVVIALLMVAVATLYLVQLPSSLASTLASILPF